MQQTDQQQPLEVQGHTVPQQKALRYGKDRERGLSCGSTFNICQDTIKSETLLHKLTLLIFNRTSLYIFIYLYVYDVDFHDLPEQLNLQQKLLKQVQWQHEISNTLSHKHNENGVTLKRKNIPSNYCHLQFKVIQGIQRHTLHHCNSRGCKSVSSQSLRIEKSIQHTP